MIKKKYSYILLIIILFNSSFLLADISIVSRIEGDIITNYDIKKESNYLKILNPKLIELDALQFEEISKNTLINEIIKKKEITKFIDINQENKFLDTYIKDLASSLNLNNIEELEKKLISEDAYTIEKLKKKINIELYWNELIYSKYKSQIKINENKINNQLNEFKEKQEEYLLAEIIFKKDSKDLIEDKIEKIKSSIKEIGFNNTANIFSISDSSKKGGKLGWIKANSLSKEIFEELKKIENGQITEVINIGNNYLILDKEQTRIRNIEINKEEEFKRLVQQETNNQLNQFSRIFFEKSKMNYVIINE
jgi:peptidyl-prolyl cis-trans isomerase SurA